MAEDQQERHSDSLLSFCEGVLSRHQDNWPPSEEILAEEFLSCFPVSPFPEREELKQLGCKLGIEVSFRSLPPELPGYNCSYGEKKEIMIGETEIFPGVITHSFFHEMREIIEDVFIDLGYPTESGKQMEERAEHFAEAVRINSANKLLLGSVEEVRKIPSKVRRWGAFLLVFIFALGHRIGCLLLPYFEGRMPPRD